MLYMGVARTGSGKTLGGSFSDAIFGDSGADDFWEEWMGWEGVKFCSTSD